MKNKIKAYYKELYRNRFDIYLSIQLLILFGALIFPDMFFENSIRPILFSLNILTGTLIISKKRKLVWLFLSLLVFSTMIFGAENISNRENISFYTLFRIGVYFVFNIIVTYHVILQVWKEKEVDKKVILGLISGYISLGFLGYFLFIAINIGYPDAFAGPLLNTTDFATYSDSLLYYSFITLLTIGYGEIVPVIPVAQKAAILVGLAGQFYIAIITAVIVTKYINNINSNE